MPGCGVLGLTDDHLVQLSMGTPRCHRVESLGLDVDGYLRAGPTDQGG